MENQSNENQEYKSNNNYDWKKDLEEYCKNNPDNGVSTTYQYNKQARKDIETKNITYAYLLIALFLVILIVYISKNFQKKDN